MQAEVVIALIAAGSALAVSLGTGVAQLLQARSSNRHDQELRSQDKIRELASKNFAAYQDAVVEACRSIQGLRDEILLLTKAAPRSLLSEGQHKRLLKARDRVLVAYREHHPYLKDGERVLFNQAREKAVEVVASLDLEEVWLQEFLSLGDQLVQELDRTALALNACHEGLLLAGYSSLQAAVRELRI